MQRRDLGQQPDQLHVPVVRALRRTRRRRPPHRRTNELTLSEDDVAAGAIFQCKVTATNAGGSTVMWSISGSRNPTVPRPAATSASNSRGDASLRRGAPAASRPRSTAEPSSRSASRPTPARRASTGRAWGSSRNRAASRSTTRPAATAPSTSGTTELPGAEAHSDRGADLRNRQWRQPGDGRQPLRRRLRRRLFCRHQGGGSRTGGVRWLAVSYGSGDICDFGTKSPATTNSATRSQSTQTTAISTSSTPTNSTAYRGKRGSRRSTAPASSSARRGARCSSARSIRSR